MHREKHLSINQTKDAFGLFSISGMFFSAEFRWKKAVPAHEHSSRVPVAAVVY